MTLTTTARNRRHPDLNQLQKMSARFAPVDIKVDTSTLPDNERQALVKIIQAAQVLDALFLRQVSARNESRLLLLLNDTQPVGQGAAQLLPREQGPVVRAR